MKTGHKIKFFGILVMSCALVGTFSMPAAAEKIAPTRTLEGESKPQGNLTVFSEPPGMVVFLDGDQMGKTPVRLKGIKAGIHKVKIEDSETEINVPPDESPMLSYFKGSFVEIPERKNEIEKEPTQKVEKEPKVKVSTQKKQGEMEYEFFYWLTNPESPIYPMNR